MLRGEERGKRERAIRGERKRTQDSMRVHDDSHVAVGGEVKVWMVALPLCYFRRSACAHVRRRVQPVTGLRALWLGSCCRSALRAAKAMMRAGNSGERGAHLLRKSMPATKDFTTKDLSILRIGPFSPAKRIARSLSHLLTVSTPFARLSQLAGSHSTHHQTTVTISTTTQPVSSKMDHDGHRLGICTV